MTTNTNIPQKSATKKPIVITTGEPAGIGMDIVLDVFLNKDAPQAVVLACHKTLVARYALLQKNIHFDKQPVFVCLGKFDDTFDKLSAKIQDNDFDRTQNNSCDNAGVPIFIIDTPVANTVQAGVLDCQNAQMVQNQLDTAHTLAINQAVSAIVTAPLAKSVMIDGGVCLPTGELFVGHTEYFMAKCRLDKVVMMLANTAMKVALVTTHIPLKKVADSITPQAVDNTVKIVYDSLLKYQMSRQINAPKILVCGLNPHAGESGHLGDEEQYIINPVLKTWQDKGVNISQALPADTIFTPKHLNDCDVIIAMYHDQGLAPLKSHGFGDTVNITLGLPYIRTSVDHGTALDLAGTGKALSSSLSVAIDMAIDMTI